MTHAPTGLDALLAQAQTAAPMDRIELRDPIAAHGELAIDAMTDWLGDPRLAAFAIRVLERIAREPANREAVVATLAAVDQDQLAPGLAVDIRTVLTNMGADIKGGAPVAPPRHARRAGDGPPGRAGAGLLGHADEPLGAPVHLVRGLQGTPAPGLGLGRQPELGRHRRRRSTRGGTSTRSSGWPAAR